LAGEQRKLAAILVADVVGYSKLIGSDEAGTLAQLSSLHTGIIEPQLARHAGRLFKSVGDGFLIEFASAVQAVSCARAIQEANASGRLPLRIGIHVGDVVVQGDDLLGDGVNVAARIESTAEAGGIALSRQAYDQVRDRLDIGFIDKGKIGLKNIARPVQVFVVGSKEPSPAQSALPLPDKPSMAVLPFQNMSGDPEQEYFADGVVEDIITALSRTRSLFVIARNSSFTYKGKAVDIKQVGRELGVQYVLEGSVRKAGSRVRITGQLIDASSNAHIWADRFEGGLDDIFELQDRVTSQVVAAIAPAVERAEIERSRVKPPRNLQAYDYYLRGLSQVALFTNEANDLALELFRKAMSLEPGFAWPYGRAAACYHHRKSWAWTTDPAREAIEAERLARQAIALDNCDPKVLTDAGWVLAYIVGRFEEGRALLDQAIEIDPNNSGTWNYRGWVEWALGGIRGVDYFARALRHNPVDVRRFGAQAGMANALFRIGRNEEALSWVEKVLLHYPGFLPTHWASMAANAALGRLDEARAAYEMYRRIHPAARISNIGQWMPTTSDEVSAMYFTGFRTAGMPE
jgi:adenylate cyclase